MTTSPPSKKARTASPPLHTAPSALAEASTSSQGLDKAALSSRSAHNGAHSNGSSGSRHNPDVAWAKKVKARERDRQATLSKTGEEPVWFDIVQLLGQDKITEVMHNEGKGGGEWADRFQRGTIIEGRVERLTANGWGVIVPPSRDWILTVPHALPGEEVKVRVDRNERLHSKCDLVEVMRKSPQRRDDLIGCKYFGECSGCQYQMLSYQDQLQIKQDVVTRAFAHYSGLPQDQLPATLPTLPSPAEYSYRTKLTPHFEIPRSLATFRREHDGRNGGRSRGRGGKRSNSRKQAPAMPEMEIEELEELNRQWSEETRVGFDSVKQGGKMGVLDIEECPIATPAINAALPVEMKKVKSSINSFPNGATILLRDSIRAPAFGQTEAEAAKGPTSTRDGRPSPGVIGESEVVTSYRSLVREKVEDIRFETPSGSFFQNNRAILSSLVDYVRQAIIAARSDASDSTDPDQEHYLVDTYCGSGLFALCLSPLFKKVAGVEISTESIAYAKRNAELNGMKDVEFLAGNAEDIFATIQFPSERTTVVIDPPRRGCDEAFIKQLVALGPALVVYVSCNVHTQARDVGSILRKAPEYEITSIRGADLFPQTYHVEGICVLRKRASYSGSKGQPS